MVFLILVVYYNFMGWRWVGGGGEGEAEVGSQAGELKMMSFFEDAPVTPLLLASRPWDPAASLPVQVGTERGTVPLPSVLRLHLARFQ